MRDALALTYSDIRTVKTRGVFQLVLEAPIEGMKDAMDMLGAPVPSSEVWVAVARIKAPAEAPKDLPAPSKLATAAAIICTEPAFQKWAALRGYEQTEEGAAEFVRQECGVASRAEIARDQPSGEKFLELRTDYKLWLQGIEG